MQSALNELRTDVMTVQRAETHTTEYGAERESLQTVYENEPCRLSFSGAAVSPDGALPRIEYTALLFCDPAYAILPGDAVTVTRCGQVYRGKAGESARYPSHTQIPLAIDGR